MWASDPHKSSLGIRLPPPKRLTGGGGSTLVRIGDLLQFIIATTNQVYDVAHLRGEADTRAEPIPPLRGKISDFLLTTLDEAYRSRGVH